MAGAKVTPKQMMKELRDIGGAMYAIKTSFMAIVAPINNLANTLKKVAEVGDMSRLGVQGVNNVSRFGAAVKALGGDARSAGQLFNKLEANLQDLRMGGSGGNLENVAIRYGLVFTGNETADEYMEKIRDKMSRLDEHGQLALQRDLGLSAAEFKLVTMSVDEYAAHMARAAQLQPTNKEQAARAERMRNSMAELSLACEKFGNALADIISPLAGVISSLATLIAWLAESKLAVGAVFAAMCVTWLFGLKKLIATIRVFVSIARGTQTVGSAIASSFNGMSRAAHMILHPIKTLNGAFFALRNPLLWLQTHPSRIFNLMGQGIAKLEALKNFRLTWLEKMGASLVKIKRVFDAGFAFGGFKGGINALRQMFNIGGRVKALFASFKSIKLASLISLNGLGRIRGMLSGLKGLFNIRSIISSIGSVMNISKILTGTMKVVGKSIFSAFMFAFDGVSIAVKNFKKYIVDGWDTVTSFFSDTLGGLFSSFGSIFVQFWKKGLVGAMSATFSFFSQFFSTVGSFCSGFIEGLGTGIADVFGQLFGWLLPDSWCACIRGWTETLFEWLGNIPQWIGDAFSKAFDFIGDLWDKATSWLPSWLGGKSDEEKKKEKEKKESPKKKEKEEEPKDGKYYDYKASGKDGKELSSGRIKLTQDEVDKLENRGKYKGKEINPFEALNDIQRNHGIEGDKFSLEVSKDQRDDQKKKNEEDEKKNKFPTQRGSVALPKIRPGEKEYDYYDRVTQLNMERAAAWNLSDDEMELFEDRIDRTSHYGIPTPYRTTKNGGKEVNPEWAKWQAGFSEEQRNGRIKLMSSDGTGKVNPDTQSMLTTAVDAAATALSQAQKAMNTAGGNLARANEAASAAPTMVANTYDNRSETSNAQNVHIQTGPMKFEVSGKGAEEVVDLSADMFTKYWSGALTRCARSE